MGLVAFAILNLLREKGSFLRSYPYRTPSSDFDIPGKVWPAREQHPRRCAHRYLLTNYKEGRIRCDRSRGVVRRFQTGEPHEIGASAEIDRNARRVRGGRGAARRSCPDRWTKGR